MSCLDRIMELTDVIEERVLAGDWAGATGLDIERRHLLGEMFARDSDAATSNANRAIIEQLRARNEAAIAAVGSARQALTIVARMPSIRRRSRILARTSVRCVRPMSCTRRQDRNF